MPLQTAWIAESDLLGRNAVLVPMAQVLWIFLVPSLAGYVTQTASYSAAIVVCLVILILSFSCVIVAGDLTPADQH